MFCDVPMVNITLAIQMIWNGVSPSTKAAAFVILPQGGDQLR